MEFEFAVSIDNGEMADTMEFTFDDVHEAMLFSMMAKKHSDIDALVLIEVLNNGDDEDEEE